MSYDNREEDKQQILALKGGEEYYFNMFQDGGAMVIRIPEFNNYYRLYEIPLYGGVPAFDRTFYIDEIDDILNEVYETWI